MTTRESEDSADSCGYYSKPLRAIGCALEATDVGAFEINYETRNFVIKVQSQGRNKPQLKRNLNSTVTEVLQRVISNFNRRTDSNDVELIYTPEHLEQLDHEGQLRRRGGGNLDPHSLPQSLRAIGAYLDLKGARLVRICKRGPCTTIEYDSPQDGRTTEQFTPTTLYELFVRMYVKRSERVKDTY